jgi:quercetin dioxygenase-like cupin family protein
MKEPTDRTLQQDVTKYRWDDIPEEPLNELLGRKLITGDRMMMAHVLLKKGCVVPAHSHDNEQLTYILKGALKFDIGGKEIILREGEVLVIPSNVVHGAVALEDTLDLDVFSPPRQDWLNKTDDYLRGK